MIDFFFPPQRDSALASAASRELWKIQEIQGHTGGRRGLFPRWVHEAKEHGQSHRTTDQSREVFAYKNKTVWCESALSNGAEHVFRFCAHRRHPI